ncbi:glycosyltransferase [Lacrimispora amygdalina]|uniref:Glycosyltransferase n=1 Tax=Lacrimispora amygdalina TaxID=253257 RepID=A0A3E2NIY0_9FIRM|nr:glycosyltransferase [Clostridium indicum]RFZ80881.1 glycosyltransferase [Clostridium indicum]
MKKINFVKYNKTRREAFQIRTSLVEENGLPYVEKSALTAEGIPHIRSFEEKYRNLKEQNQGLNVADVTVSADGTTARFSFLKGETYAELLGREIQNGKVPEASLEEGISMILKVHDDYMTPFHVTEEFEEVFGVLPDTGEQIKRDWAFKHSNIDCLFENIMMTEDGPYCLDYEWVFSFPVPVNFIKFRVLYYFYEQYKSILSYDSMEAFMEEQGVDRELIGIYEDMERHFQEYVHGENQQIYLLNYMHETFALPDSMFEVSQIIDDTKDRIAQMKAELKEKDLTITKQQEEKRLTDNHVTNQEMIIASLRKDCETMQGIIEQLRKHESFFYKVWRRLGRIFNEKFPKGTKKRKILFYMKETILHPIKSISLYTTDEGRNLMEGDMKIGEEYRIHGKLRFVKEGHPMVSIVIPVYNQIHYTYACLLSILEHTKNVDYEVIIADDVSSDATAELSKFTENVVICRNETNQGFLRNCNQAAKSARGKYIMFLNNDTQVTDGWLDSLVNLIESDSSIGMVGSKLVYPDGRLQEAGGILWSDGSGWNYGRLDDPEKPEYNYVKDVDYISGAAILLSNDLWKQIGGFDERFAPAYCEDSDLAFEVRKAGYRVVYQPLSKVIHFEGVSNGTDVNGSGLKRYQVENSKKLKEKWAAQFSLQSENNGNPDPFRARERSQGKDIILVVDHYVPTYDRDAGSKTTFQYLKMFIDKGYVVKFLGDNFLHEEPYSTALQQMGIEILYGREYQAGIWDWLKSHGDDIKAAYLNRPHIAQKYIDFLREHTSMKLIYYGHDLHFLREGREYELTGDPKKREASEYWRSMELRLMKKAAVSYYPSYVEREAIHEIEPSVPVKAIVAYVFDKFLNHIPDDFEKREGLLFVGGFAHPPNADAVLWFARDIFPLIREQIPVNFYIVGSKVTDEIKALEQPDNGIIVKGFVTEEELASLYASCRIVVVPLRYGAGVKGKVIEALYYGAPVVTTSIGAEGIPEAEKVMVVRDEPETFAEEVITLYNDPDSLRQMSQNTQDYIRTYHSIDAAWSVVGEDF